MTTTPATAAERLDAFLESGGDEAAARRDLDEIIQLAAASGDEETEYRAKLLLVTLSNIVGDIDARLSAFAWCLARHQEDPVRFPAEFEGSDLFWQYKWMPGTLQTMPEVPLTTIEAVLDDMEQQYTRAGLGLSGVYSARFHVAHRRGDIEQAARWLQAVAVTPRDDYSHCHACTIATEACFHANLGDHARAVELAERMFAEGYECGEEPEDTQATLALSYLELGDPDRAVEMFERSYAASRRDPDRLHTITEHIEFCTLTGNLARGLAIVERHLPWVGHDPRARDEHYWALAEVGRLMEALVAAGRGDIVVHNSDHPGLDPYLGERAEPLTAGELAARIWPVLDGIAAAFDARNGTTRYADGVAAARTGSAPRFSVQLDAGALLPAVAPVPADEAPSQALERAIGLAVLGDVPAAAEIAARVIDDLIGIEKSEAAGILVSATDNSEEETRLHAVAVQALRDIGHPEEETASLERLGPRTGEIDEARIEFLRAELAAATPGTHLQARLETELSLSLAQAGRLDEGRALLESALAHVDQARPLLRERIVFTETQFARAFDDFDWLRAAIERAEQAQLSDGYRARLLHLKGLIVGGAGDYAGAAALVDEAIGIAARLGSRGTAITWAELAASMLGDAGDAEGALHRMRFAIDQATQLGWVAPPLRSTFIGALIAAGDPDEAAQHAAEQLAELERLEADPSWFADAWELMARAQRDRGDDEAAIVAVDAAIAAREQTGDPETLARTVLWRANLLLRAERYEEAITGIDARLPWLDSLEDPELRVRARFTRADALAQNWDEGAAAAYEEAQQLALDHDLLLLAADIQDSLARELLLTDRIDESIRWALTASETARSVGAFAMAARSELYIAYWLAHKDREADGAAIAIGAYEWMRTDAPDELAGALTTILDILEAAGAAEQLARIRAEVAA